MSVSRSVALIVHIDSSLILTISHQCTTRTCNRQKHHCHHPPSSSNSSQQPAHYRPNVCLCAMCVFSVCVCCVYMCMCFREKDTHTQTHSARPAIDRPRWPQRGRATLRDLIMLCSPRANALPRPLGYRCWQCAHRLTEEKKDEGKKNAPTNIQIENSRRMEISPLLPTTCARKVARANRMGFPFQGPFDAHAKHTNANICVRK